MKRKRVIIISLLIFTALAVPASVYGYSYHSYKTDLKHADTLLSSGHYEDSITAYNNLKSNKFSKLDITVIDSSIQLASELKLSKEAFDNSVKLFEQKKYLEAIDSFKNVKASDKERYGQAQGKIKEAGELYITDNITKAKAEANNGHYDNAVTFLDNILKFDQNNQEAVNLKDTYNREIQKLKDEETARKQAEEAAKKKTEEARKTAVSNTPQAASKPAATITSESADNILRIHDNGVTITVQFSEMFDPQLNSLYYNIVATSNAGPSLYTALSLNYTATFTSNGVETKDSSITQASPRFEKAVYIKIFNGGIAKINVTYKGHVFTFTGTLNH